MVHECGPRSPAPAIPCRAGRAPQPAAQAEASATPASRAAGTAAAAAAAEPCWWDPLDAEKVSQCGRLWARVAPARHLLQPPVCCVRSIPALQWSRTSGLTWCIAAPRPPPQCANDCMAGSSSPFSRCLLSALTMVWLALHCPALGVQVKAVKAALHISAYSTGGACGILLPGLQAAGRVLYLTVAWGPCTQSRASRCREIDGREQCVPSCRLGDFSSWGCEAGLVFRHLPGPAMCCRPHPRLP